jgi:phosphoribosylformimino-5-aminoimidazole carboxamide ribonucleotide (ProFAR) isomerase
VSFEVIPAIDLWKGRLARVGPEGPAFIGAFRGDPLEAAWTFQQSGIRWLHVVDLDLAFTGEPANLPVLAELCELPVRVEASGGVASAAHVEDALGAGAERVVLGAAALFDRKLTEFLIAAHAERLAVGLEVVDDLVVPRGVDPPAPLSVDEVLAWLLPAGPARFVLTDVGRVGALSGVDLERAAALAERTGVPVIVSGGIGSLADLTALAARAPAIEGAIVGRALYERLDLVDVMRAVGAA